MRQNEMKPGRPFADGLATKMPSIINITLETAMKIVNVSKPMTDEINVDEGTELRELGLAELETIGGGGHISPTVVGALSQ
jgi:hypothetical protein